MRAALTTASVALRRVWPPSPLSFGGVPIRALCVGLVILCLLPAFVLAALLAEQLAATKRAELQANAERVSRELAAVIDQELISYRKILELLASSRHLANNDLAAFETEARTAAERLGLLVVLRDTDRHIQLFNTALPPGARLPEQQVTVQEPLRTVEPFVSNLILGNVLKEYLVIVQIPVMIGGKPAYVLSLGIKPDRFRSVFDRVPNGSVDRVVLADGNGRAITRLNDQDRWTGQKLSIPAMQGDGPPSGTFVDKNREGIVVFGAYKALSEASWRVGASVPQSVVDGPLHNTLIILGAFAVCVLAISTYAASRFGSALANSIRQLARAGVALGRMEPVQRVVTPFSEANAVAQELYNASHALVQTDERKRFAVDAAGAGVYDRDIEAGKLYWSPQFREIMGLPRDAEPDDDLFLQQILPADRETIIENRRRYRSEINGPDHYEYELRLSPRDGCALRWLAAKGRVVRNASGVAVRVHGILLDITERKQMEQDREELRRRLMSVQEDERLRLSHELHDETGQILAAALLELKLIESMSGPEATARINRLQKRLEGMGQSLHRIAWELRPASLGELGLADAVQNYASSWSREYGIETDVHCEGDLSDLESDVSTAVYRVLQEALTNVAKHAAQATVVSIVLDRSGEQLRLTIEDDGQGFNATATMQAGPLGGIGLAGIRERLSLIGGSVEIESSADSGTGIFARIPLARAA